MNSDCVCETIDVKADPESMAKALEVVAGRIRDNGGNLILLALTVSPGSEPDEWFVQAFYDVEEGEA